MDKPIPVVTDIKLLSLTFKIKEDENPLISHINFWLVTA